MPPPISVESNKVPGTAAVTQPAITAAVVKMLDTVPVDMLETLAFATFRHAKMLEAVIDLATFGAGAEKMATSWSSS